jgi:hypothetical protein
MQELNQYLLRAEEVTEVKPFKRLEYTEELQGVERNQQQ